MDRRRNPLLLPTIRETQPFEISEQDSPNKQTRTSPLRIIRLCAGVLAVREHQSTIFLDWSVQVQIPEEHYHNLRIDRPDHLVCVRWHHSELRQNWDKRVLGSDLGGFSRDFCSTLLQLGGGASQTQKIHMHLPGNKCCTHDAYRGICTLVLAQK